MLLSWSIFLCKSTGSPPSEILHGTESALLVPQRGTFLLRGNEVEGILSLKLRFHRLIGQPKQSFCLAVLPPTPERTSTDGTHYPTSSEMDPSRSIGPRSVPIPC